MFKGRVRPQASWRGKTALPATGGGGIEQQRRGQGAAGAGTLMFAESVRNIAIRSMPMPQPPVGGRPHSSALQKSSSSTCASSSPLACGGARREQRSRARKQLQKLHTDLVLGLLRKPLALNERIVELRVPATANASAMRTQFFTTRPARSLTRCTAPSCRRTARIAQ